MIGEPPRSTRVRSSAASDVYKRQLYGARDESLADVDKRQQSAGERDGAVMRNPGRYLKPSVATRLSMVRVALIQRQPARVGEDHGPQVIGQPRLPRRRKRRVEPCPTLGQHAAYQPEPEERAAQAGVPFEILCLPEGLEREADVRLVGLDPVKPDHLFRTLQQLRGPLGEVQVVGRMPFPDRVIFPGSA